MRKTLSQRVQSTVLLATNSVQGRMEYTAAHHQPSPDYNTSLFSSTIVMPAHQKCPTTHRQSRSPSMTVTSKSQFKITMKLVLSQILSVEIGPSNYSTRRYWTHFWDDCWSGIYVGGSFEWSYMDDESAELNEFSIELFDEYGMIKSEFVGFMSIVKDQVCGEESWRRVRIVYVDPVVRVKPEVWVPNVLVIVLYV